MQQPPSAGYGNYPQNGNLQQKGYPQGYPQVAGGDLSNQMSNLQLGNQQYNQPGGFVPPINGQSQQQYSNGPGGYTPGMPPQQFRPPPSQTPLTNYQQGPTNGFNGPPTGPSTQNNRGAPPNGPAQQFGGPPTGLTGPPSGLPPTAGQSSVTQQQFAQPSGPPSGPPQTGGPPSGPTQMSGPSAGPSQRTGLPTGPGQLGGPPQMVGPAQGPPQSNGLGNRPAFGGQVQGTAHTSGPPSGPPPNNSGMRPPQMSGPPSGPQHFGGPPSGPQQMSGPPSGPQQFNSPTPASSSSAPPSGPSFGGPPTGIAPHNGTPSLSGPQTGPPSYNAPPTGPSSFNGHPSGPSSFNGPPTGPPTGPPHQIGSPMQQSGPPTGPPHQIGGPMQQSGPPSGPPMSGPLPGPPSGSTFGQSGPQRPVGFPPQNVPAANPMMPPMAGPPGGPGVQNGPQSAFQPPQGYSMGSPMSPPGQFAPQGPGSQGPPNMYNQQNGQYPPMQQPGYPQQQQPGQTGYPQQPGAYPQNAAQQARKLDPDQMPSPIQVIEDDRKLHETTFGTSRLGTLPPLVTTDAEIQDEGNAGPNYIRSTVYTVPCSPDVIKQTQVPLAVSITPFARHARADGALPLSVFNEEIVRCNRCKAYMCPFMQFMDGGRRFQCVFCKATSEVPQNYFNHLDHTGNRVDKWQRAELCLGSYEVLATQEYCKNNQFPKAPPAFIFIIDVSYNAVKNGMVRIFCDNIKDILAKFPTEEEDHEGASQVRVGFITYSSQVQFYNVDPKLTQPQMMVVPDVSDMFVPFLEGCLVKPSEAMSVIESLSQEIPKMFQDTRETETILGPAIEAGLEALKAAECPGKLFVLHTTLPTAEAPGKLKNRDDRKLLGTDKEKTVLVPAAPYYQELASNCVQAGCSVDLFIANNSYVDIASIGQVAKVTGGEIYKYTYFQADTDGERFLTDLKRDVSKPIAFDAVMRVRTSTGLRPTDFYGNFFMQNTTDIELASVDCDKCITVEMKYDDKLPEGEPAFVQVALLYTSVKGVRKLRLHNLCLQTSSIMADMFKGCELDTIMNLLCKQALRQLIETSPKAVREAVTLRAATILANYRKHCATASSSGQLILPECMKLLPLYACSMIKCDALSGGPELTVDDRAFGMLAVSSMDVKTSQVYLYPRLLAVHNLDPETDGVPVASRTSFERLQENGAYILENGMIIFLYVGLQVDPVWCESVFGVSTPAQINVDRGVPVFSNPKSKSLNQLIATIRCERQRFMKLYIVRQGDKWQRVLQQFLVEDRMSDVQPSYVDYLCQLHREIRNMIN